MMMVHHRLYQRLFLNVHSVKRLVLRVRSGRAFTASSQASNNDGASSHSRSQSQHVFGLGGHQWANVSLETYNDTVATALLHHVDTLEAGPEDGPLALAQAVRTALQKHPQQLLQHEHTKSNQSITLLVRVGYRTAVPGSDVAPHLEGDIKVDEIVSAATNTNDTNNNSASSPSSSSLTAPVLHNIGPDAIVNALETNLAPLLQLSQEHANIHLAILLHNPEVQGSQLGAPMTERQAHIQNQLSQGMAVLQELVRAQTLKAYGVVSNGINLPQDHPLYLDHLTIHQAMTQHSHNHSQSYNNHTHQHQLPFILQLPMNLLERRGEEVAQRIRQTYPQWTIYAMRPLTCYPDLGTGTGKPILLADHYIKQHTTNTTADTTNNGQWTNRLSSPPETYTRALHLALSHLDAEELMEKKLQSPSSLTPDEQETLEAAQWLQSLLHDVDAKLDTVRSMAAQNDYILRELLPLLHETLDGCDDETATLLQNYFAAYFTALEYASAKNVRKLLKQGEPGSNIPQCSDLIPETRLQEYALQYVLQGNLVDKVLVGCLAPEQVKDTLEIVERIHCSNSQER